MELPILAKETCKAESSGGHLKNLFVDLSRYLLLLVDSGEPGPDQPHGADDDHDDDVQKTIYL